LGLGVRTSRGLRAHGGFSIEGGRKSAGGIESRFSAQASRWVWAN
jgi:hypothetical protein